MAELDHWHPAILAKKVKRRPVRVTICGEDIAIYRQKNGTIAALKDACPHRRMRLSLGHVEGEKLVCPYHGWKFTSDGQGESPGTPKMHACTVAYDCCEAHGYIWVKRTGSTAIFPSFDIEGWTWVGSADFTAEAPLELTLDNFCEIEHTPEVHLVFGYDQHRMAEVEVRSESTDDSTSIFTTGPAMPINRFLSFAIGINRDYHFIDEWTTRFSPVHSVYDHSWRDPKTGTPSKVRWRVYVFFTPVDPQRTNVTAITYAKSSWPGPSGGIRPFRWLMRRHLRREVGRDLAILRGLASFEPDVEGMKLSRFDKALVLNRERINRIYRGLVTASKRPLPITAEQPS